MRGSK